MSNMLDRLAWMLTSVVAGAGFVLTDLGASEDNAEAVMRHLEYRAKLPDRRHVLLDVCELPAPRIITATMWSPEDVARALPTSSVDSVAIHCRSWHYDQSTDATEFAVEIRSELAAWLATCNQPQSQ